ncbi:MAG: hypothetical protein BGN96_14695 [Bacteroidales bacterium 45-6]|nr:MAG: hypothetical protein BGN96_14695 [Bacteroidales bacterium 45-6]
MKVTKKQRQVFWVQFRHFPENFVTPLTKEKAKNRTFTNELEARLQSALNGNKIGTLRKRPTNDENRT